MGWIRTLQIVSCNMVVVHCIQINLYFHLIHSLSFCVPNLFKDFSSYNNGKYYVMTGPLRWFFYIVYILIYFERRRPEIQHKGIFQQSIFHEISVILFSGVCILFYCGYKYNLWVVFLSDFWLYHICCHFLPCVMEANLFFKKNPLIMNKKSFLSFI